MSAPGWEGDNLNDLGRGPLADAISEAWALCFQTRFLKFFSVWVYVKQVTPDAEPILNPGL